VTVWGLRLALHILWRRRGHGEDRRYAAMRATRGAAFWWQSLFTIFLLQGFLQWLISLGVQLDIAAATPPRWTAWDLAGAPPSEPPVSSSRRWATRSSPASSGTRPTAAESWTGGFGATRAIPTTSARR